MNFMGTRTQSILTAEFVWQITAKKGNGFLIGTFRFNMIDFVGAIESGCLFCFLGFFDSTYFQDLTFPGTVMPQHCFL